MIDRTEQVEPARSPGNHPGDTPLLHASRGTSIRWARWFALIGGLIGLASLLITPPVRASDEFSHLGRVSSIQQGHLLPIIDGKRPVDYPFDGCTRGYLIAMYANLWVKPPPKWGWQFDAPPCFTADDMRGLGELRINNTEINSPVAYVPAIVGFSAGRAVGGPVWGVYGARLVQLLASIALLCLAIYLTPRGKPFLFALSLIPAVIQLTGNVSADPVTTGLAFVTVAFTLRMIDRYRCHGRIASSRELIVYGMLLILLVLCKAVNAPLILVAALIPTGVFGSALRRVGFLVTALGTAGVVAIAWSAGVVSKIRVAIFYGADSLAATEWIKTHPVEFVASAARGWTDLTEVHNVATELITINTNAPVQAWWLIGAMTAAVIATLFTERAISGTRERWSTWIGVGVIAFIAFWMIEIGVAISSVPPGAHKVIWVQGRYFIPFVPLILLLTRYGRQETSRQRLLVTAVLPITFLVLLNLWWLSVVARTYYAW